ncbi:hypothetical protein SAMN04488568_11150 [Maricaulis salignorans]|uniref:Uncharacterized protein n=2 Tax=Maricaulis salignorans TaxID=144026 RepID=A0A1G9T6R7_9PROT|nr:hypothetical protein SAMN04488568_11150 [Maricaulis salignorans]
MGPAVLVPFFGCVMIALIVFIAVNGGTQKRKAALHTVEEAIRAGQQLTPELVSSLGMPNKDRGGDLKSGAILLAVAIAFVVLGWTATGIDDEVEDAFRVMAGIAAFPGLIGLVLIGFGLMGSKKDAK